MLVSRTHLSTNPRTPTAIETYARPLLVSSASSAMGKGAHVEDYPPPTDTEHERMQGLRAMLRNADLELPRTMRIPANGGEARAILRFTRARKDTEKSFAMLEKSLVWRREVGADDCLAAPLSEEHARILSEIPGFYVGHGTRGHPVFLDHTAVVPWDMILEKMGMATFLYAQVQLLEYTQQVVYQTASRKYGKPITQGINVWDVKGLTLSKFTAKVREISSRTSKIAQDNYPESLAAAYVINAPSIFKVIWAVISSFLDPKTVAKVHIYGSGPKAFAKLKAHLGDDCFLTQEMVCCGVKQVGDAEKRMGMQSGMAAAQAWIRERNESNIPWYADEASVFVDADSDYSDADEPNGAGASFLRLVGLRRSTSTVADSDNGDDFFDAEEDAFSTFDDSPCDGIGPSARYQAMPSAPGSTVKLIDSASQPSDAAEAEKREVAKDAAAERKTKSCCRCC